MSFISIAFSFRLGESTVRNIVKRTCTAINENLMDIYMPKMTIDDWEKIAKDFLLKWQIPNCVGALDGKHVAIFAPMNSGSLYFNYKKHYSIVLMAIVDANYKYIMIDVGGYGSNSDGAIFANSDFGQAWLQRMGDLPIPEDRPLPLSESNLKVPLVIVADEAFPLKPNILRPYPGLNLSQKKLICNYRISRARRVVENAFGIMSHTWRIMLKRMEVSVDFAIQITMTCCVLQNFLLATSSDRSALDNDIENQPTNHRSNSDTPLSIHGSSPTYPRPTAEALQIREEFANWFISPAGALPYQNDMI